MKDQGILPAGSIDNQTKYTDGLKEEKELREWMEANDSLIFLANYHWDRQSHCAGQVISKQGF